MPIPQTFKVFVETKSHDPNKFKIVFEEILKLGYGNIGMEASPTCLEQIHFYINRYWRNSLPSFRVYYHSVRRNSIKSKLKFH